VSAATHGGSTGYLPGHHFDNLGQQQSSVKIGMWMFLVTEVMFFGGIMCAYTAYRIWYPSDFQAGSAALNPVIAVVNTFLLLASSFTITLGIRSCFEKNVEGLKRWLMLTIILGTVFLVFKGYEYYTDYQEGLIPTAVTEKKQVAMTGPNGEVFYQYRSEGRFEKALFKVLEEKNEHLDAQSKIDLTKVNPYRVQLFFLFYYSMTGLHVIHMIVGIGLLVWQYIMCHTGFFRHPERYVYIECMSLYWHFVDMVWMFLLPLLYFCGPHNIGGEIAGLLKSFSGGH
jgi:cytochrome c oxidase subunit III